VSPLGYISKFVDPVPLKIQIWLALKSELTRVALKAAKMGLKGMLKADTMDTKMAEKRDERKVAGRAVRLVARRVA
jgi:hypothetical protein